MSPVFLAPLIVACALFMESVDANIIVTALPAMARDFGHSPVTLNIAITAYVVGLRRVHSDLRLAGRPLQRTFRIPHRDRHLRRRLADVRGLHSLGVLTFARFIQGVGGAMMVPVGRIIIFRAVPRSDLVRAMNYLAIPALFGHGRAARRRLHHDLPALADDLLHQRADRHLRDLSRQQAHREHARPIRPLDWFGFLLSASGAALLLMGLTLIDGSLTSRSNALVMCVAGTALLALYVPYARRKERPVLDLSFLKIPTYHASVVGGSLFRIGLGAVPFLLPLALQEGRHERVPLSHHVRVRVRRRDEPLDGHPYAAPLRLPHRADLQRGLRGNRDRRVRRVPSRHGDGRSG